MSYAVEDFQHPGLMPRYPQGLGPELKLTSLNSRLTAAFNEISQSLQTLSPEGIDALEMDLSRVREELLKPLSRLAQRLPTESTDEQLLNRADELEQQNQLRYLQLQTDFFQYRLTSAFAQITPRINPQLGLEEAKTIQQRLLGISSNLLEPYHDAIEFAPPSAKKTSDLTSYVAFQRQLHDSLERVSLRISSEIKT